MAASSVLLHPPTRQAPSTSPSAIPQLLRTPSGLAILELQGTINLPQDPGSGAVEDADVPIGRIEFPDYSPDAIGSAWMKRVFMYVGQHQRLIGEVKKLPRALAVVRRREDSDSAASESGEGGESLEVVDIVTHKLMFSGRPEPVGTTHALA